MQEHLSNGERLSLRLDAPGCVMWERKLDTGEREQQNRQTSPIYLTKIQVERGDGGNETRIHLYLIQLHNYIRQNQEGKAVRLTETGGCIRVRFMQLADSVRALCDWGREVAVRDRKQKQE